MARQNKRLKSLLGSSLYLLIILLITYLIITFVARKATVIGVSMENTLMDGDQLIMDELSYRMDSPKRFDIVVFPQKYKVNTHLIKRIIALPGERLYIDKDGQIYINGNVLSESYGKEVIKNPGLAGREIVLADDQYFVMGDNRNESIDSRSEDVGNIYRKDIEGKIIFRLYPFDRIGAIK